MFISYNSGSDIYFSYKRKGLDVFLLRIISVFILSCVSVVSFANTTDANLEESVVALSPTVEPFTVLCVLLAVFFLVIKAHFKHSN
jgi:hypothetical protein